MKLTVSQFLGTLALDKHYPVITETRYLRLAGRLARKRPPQTRQQWRRKLFDRQCGICPYCGEPMSLEKKDRKTDRYLTEEHVVPVSQSPFPGSPRVVVGACQKCNSRKGSTPLLLFVYHLHRHATA